MQILDAAAQLTWNDYLDRVGQALRGLSPTEIAEVIQELDSHLVSEAESAAPGVPLNREQLGIIMEKLGKPQTIAAAYREEAPGEESVQAFDTALLFGALALFCLSAAFPLLQIVGLPVSVVLARMALKRPGVMDSSYRWAVYPVLLISYLALALFLAFWPLLAVLPLAATGGVLPSLVGDQLMTLQVDSTEYWIRIWSLAVFITGTWWLILLNLLRGRAAMVRILFYPFLESYEFSMSRYLLPGGLLQIGASILVVLLFS